MLKTENLSYAYTSEDGAPGHFVIDGLNLTIEKGSFVAVLGHNGSGKSTLAKHFNAILLPTGGKVYVLGMDTADESRLFDIRSSVGMVFQNPDNQIVTSIVEDEVAFAPENLGIAPDEIRRRVDAALEIAGMSEYKTASPSRLSGGQKQRVAIASALAMKPACIVLDEPTAMLDPRGREEIISTIRRLNRENNLTVVLITHYMDEAALADRVVVMKKGHIVFDDIPKKVFSHVEEIKEIGLDVPQVTELLYRLKKAGFELPGDIITVEEAADLLFKILKETQND
jgi:energy-coupling factor transport system ATP-binding protein